ncbi:scabin-related ADP-ribosyltransferase [Streptomyces sp. NPDC002523]
MARWIRETPDADGQLYVEGQPVLLLWDNAGVGDVAEVAPEGADDAGEVLEWTPSMAERLVEELNVPVFGPWGRIHQGNHNARMQPVIAVDRPGDVVRTGNKDWRPWKVFLPGGDGWVAPQPSPVPPTVSNTEWTTAQTRGLRPEDIAPPTSQSQDSAPAFTPPQGPPPLDPGSAGLLQSRNVHLDENAAPPATGFIPLPGHRSADPQHSPEFDLASLAPIDFTTVQANANGTVAPQFREDDSLLFHDLDTDDPAILSSVFADGLPALHEGPLPDLETYLLVGNATGYIATTRSDSIRDVPQGVGVRLLIDVPGGFDVEATFAGTALAGHENTVLHPGGIAPEFIVGAEIVSGAELDGETGRYTTPVTFLPNPHYWPTHRPEITVADQLPAGSVLDEQLRLQDTQPDVFTETWAEAGDLLEQHFPDGPSATAQRDWARPWVLYALHAYGEGVAEQVAERLKDRLSLAPPVTAEQMPMQEQEQEQDQATARGTEPDPAERPHLLSPSETGSASEQLFPSEATDVGDADSTPTEAEVASDLPAPAGDAGATPEESAPAGEAEAVAFLEDLWYRESQRPLDLNRLAVAVLHLRPDSRMDASHRTALLDLVVEILRAGRADELTSVRDLSLYHLMPLLGEDSVFHDAHGRPGRNWALQDAPADLGELVTDEVLVPDSDLDRIWLDVLVPAPWVQAGGSAYPVLLRRDQPGTLLHHAGTDYHLGDQELAHLLARDPLLAGQPDGVHVVLAGSGTGSGQLVAPRAVATAVGRPTWSYTSTLYQREVIQARADGVDVARLHFGAHGDDRRNLPAGVWVRSDAGDRYLFPGTTGPSDGLSTQPIVDGEGNAIGRASLPLSHWARFERSLQSANAWRTHHVLDAAGNEVVHSDVPLPWAQRGEKPYFFSAHGRNQAVHVWHSDGDELALNRVHFGQALRRRPSLSARPATDPVVLLVCNAELLLPGEDPLTHLTVGGQLANDLGRRVYASNARVQLTHRKRSPGGDLRGPFLDLKSDVSDPRWIERRPEPVQARLYQLMGTHRIPDEETALRLVRLVRHVHGVGIEDQEAFHTQLLTLYATLEARRTAHPQFARRPLTTAAMHEYALFLLAQNVSTAGIEPFLNALRTLADGTRPAPVPVPAPAPVPVPAPGPVPVPAPGPVAGLLPPGDTLSAPQESVRIQSDEHTDLSHPEPQPLPVPTSAQGAPDPRDTHPQAVADLERLREQDHVDAGPVNLDEPAAHVPHLRSDVADSTPTEPESLVTAADQVDATYMERAERLGAAFGPLSGTVMELVPTESATDGMYLQEAIAEQVEALERASTQADLDAVESRLGQLFSTVEAWRDARRAHPSQMAVQTALPGELLDRPRWYVDLVARVVETLPGLTSLPSRAHAGRAGGDGDAPRWYRVQAGEALNVAMNKVAAAYAQAAAQVAAATGSGYLTSADPLGQDPASLSLDAGQGASFERSVEHLREAKEALEGLLEEVGEQVAARQGLTAWDDGGVRQDWAPEAAYAPPKHMTGDDAVLGTEVPQWIRAETVEQIRSQIWGTLPQHVQSEANRKLIAQHTTREALTRNATSLINDSYSFTVQGHKVHVDLGLRTWRQLSDAIEIRLRSTGQRRGAMGRNYGHGYFADANLNVAWAVEEMAGREPFQMDAIEDYSGLLTIVTGEHVETNNIKVTATEERTVKNSSYQSLLFTYDATVNVRVEEPQQKIWLSRLRGGDPEPRVWRNETPPTVAEAINIFSSVESARPLDDAAAAGQKSRHVVDQDVPVRVRAEYAPDPVTLTHPIVGLPSNSTVEAFPGARRLKTEILALAGDLALPGSAARRRLEAQIGYVGLKNIVHLAARKQGYDLTFGDHDGRTPVSINIKLKPKRPQVVIESDTATWMDVDDRVTRLVEWALAHEDSMDIPPSLTLFALDFQVLASDSLTPWLWFWASLDAEAAHSGMGMTTTAMHGIRYTGEPTAVTEFAVEAQLSRSDRPQAAPVDAHLGPLWLRTLRKDAAEWAELPEPETQGGEGDPELRLDEGVGLEFGALHRFSELDGADGLLEQATTLLRDQFPGILPNQETAREGWTEGALGYLVDNKFAGSNEQQLKKGLHPETLRTHQHEMFSSGGYSFPLSKQSAFGRFGEDVMVRVRAVRGEVLDDGTIGADVPEMSAWLPDSELDVNHTEEQDNLLSVATILGLWAGPQATYRISKAAGGPLQGFDTRPMLHGRYVSTKGITAGQATYGLQGFALDGLAEFTGKTVLLLTVEGVRPPADEPATGDTTSAQEGNDAQVEDGTQVADLPLTEVVVDRSTDPQLQNTQDPQGTQNTQDPQDRVQDMPGTWPGTEGQYKPLPPALPEVHAAQPVQASYKVIVPADITSKKVIDPLTGEQVWVPYAADDLTAEELVWPAADYAGDDTGQSPEEGAQEFPLEIFVEATGDGVTAEIVSTFQELGRDFHLHISPHTRTSIEQAVAAAVVAMPTLRQRPTKIWKGELAHQQTLEWATTGHKVHGSVELQAVVEQVRTIAVPKSFGTYNDVGAITAAEVAKETTTGFLSGLRLRLPFSLGEPVTPHQEPDAHTVSGEEPEQGHGGEESHAPEPYQPWELMLQPQLTYRQENTTGQVTGRGGNIGRGNTEVSPMAVGRATVRFTATVKLWHTNRLQTYGEQKATGEVVGHGRAVMTALQATELGLMPEHLQVHRDTSVAYELPAEQVGSLQAESIYRAPDIGVLTDAVHERIKAEYDEHTAEMVLDEVGKVLGPWNTAAAMELLPDGHTITVPVTHRAHIVVDRAGIDVPTFLPVNRTFHVELKAELSDPKFTGLVPHNRHGLRHGAETWQGENSKRAARHGVDFVRFWYGYMPYAKTVNSWWNNFNLTHYGQTARKAALTEGQEASIGTTLDLADFKTGEFTRTVTWSAKITEESAPSAMIDAATLGALQGVRAYDVNPNRTGTLITRHDLNMLRLKGAPEPVTAPEPLTAVDTASAPPVAADPTETAQDAPDLEAGLARPTTDPAQNPDTPPAENTAPTDTPDGGGLVAPGWDPKLPQITTRPLDVNAPLSSVREGLDFARAEETRPGLLDVVQPLGFSGLPDLREKISRLVLPPAALYPARIHGTGDFASYVSALWQNYVSDPPPGSSWFNPRMNLLRQAGAVVNKPFLGAHFKQLVTDGVAVEIEVPGRFSTLKADLELMMDVTEVHEGNRTVNEAMLKSSLANSSKAGFNTEVLEGFYAGTWLQLAGQLEPFGAHDNVGPMLGLDHLAWETEEAPFSAQNTEATGLKTTGRDLTLLHLDVNWKAALTPHNPTTWWNPGNWLDPHTYRPKSRELFENDLPRRVSVWVPTELKHHLLNLTRDS